jgi:hypothetical protein
MPFPPYSVSEPIPVFIGGLYPPPSHDFGLRTCVTLKITANILQALHLSWLFTPV